MRYLFTALLICCTGVLSASGQARIKPDWTLVLDLVSGTPDVATAAAVDSEDNLVIVGHTGTLRMPTGGVESDWFTIKFDRFGREIWRQIYAGSAGLEDIAKAVAIDQSGDVVVTGMAMNRPNWLYEYCTVKYDGRTGAALWVNTYHARFASRSEPTAMQIDSRGDVIVTGNGPGPRSESIDDWITIKIDGRTGNLVWAMVYDHATLNDWPDAVVLDGSGNPIVGGKVYEEHPMHSDLFLVKYDGSSGETIWQTQWDSYELRGKNGIHWLVWSAQGDLYGKGSGYASFDGQIRSASQVFRFDHTTGQIVWVVSHDLRGYLRSRLLPLPNAGGIESHLIVSSNQTIRDAFGTDHYGWAFSKLAMENGATDWRSSWFQTGNRDVHENFATDILAHPNGKVYATGVVAGEIVDAAFAEIDPETGSIRFLDIYRGAAGKRDGFYTLKGLSDGSMIAVGYCVEEIETRNTDLLIRKYIEVPLADVNEDLQVDDADLAFVLSVFGFYHPDADLNEDGRIDWADAQIALDWFGWSRR